VTKRNLLLGLDRATVPSFGHWSCRSKLLSSHRHSHCELHRVSKNCAKLFLSELRQISTNFDIFWQKDGKKTKIMRSALFST